MSDDLQTMSGDSQPASPEMANDIETETDDDIETKTNGNGKRGKRGKRLKPEEITHLQQFLALMPDGQNSVLQFAELPRELKLLLLPMSNSRLVERQLIDVTYSDENGAIETATINPEAFVAYNKAMEPETAVSTPKGIRISKSQFINPHYRIVKKAETNPHREKTRRWYTWEMYVDGETIDEIRTKDYDRNIKLYTGKWFNGADRYVIEQDIHDGYLWVYDDRAPHDRPEWIACNVMRGTPPEVETLDDQEETAE